jgi:hypothetical protein
LRGFPQPRLAPACGEYSTLSPQFLRRITCRCGDYTG